MSDLIKALQIFLKYANPHYPTHCEHEVFTILGIESSAVSDEDKKELEQLGFFIGDGYSEDAFHSFRFGSA